MWMDLELINGGAGGFNKTVSIAHVCIIGRATLFFVYNATFTFGKITSSAVCFSFSVNCCTDEEGSFLPLRSLAVCHLSEGSSQGGSLSPVLSQVLCSCSNWKKTARICVPCQRVHSHGYYWHSTVGLNISSCAVTLGCFVFTGSYLLSSLI